MEWIANTLAWFYGLSREWISLFFKVLMRHMSIIYRFLLVSIYYIKTDEAELL